MSYSEGTVQVSNLLSTLVGVLTTPLAETGATAEVSIAINGTSQKAVSLVMPSVGSGVVPSGWRIYKSTAAGAEHLLTQIPGNVTTFIDDGGLTVGSTTVPASSTGTLGYLPLVPTGATTTTALSTSFLDQSLTTSNATINVAYDNVVGQPFFANYSQLSEIDLPLDIAGTPSGNIVLQIFSSRFSNLDGTTFNCPNTISGAIPLGSVTLPISSISRFATTSTYTKFVFSAPVNLTVGNYYFIVISLVTSTNTVASGNYAVVFGLGAGNTAYTPAVNALYEGTNTVFASGDWAGNAHYAINYKIYATGQLTAATYYYRVTAVSGWSSVGSQKSSSSLTSYVNTNILFSSGNSGTDAIFASFALDNATNATVVVSIIEYYDNQTNLLHYVTNALPLTNGALIAGTTKYLNSRSRAVEFYNATQTSNINVTYRVHIYGDHLFLSLAGDSSISGFAEYANFVGKLNSVSSTDKAYLISSTDPYTTGAYYQVLRDFTNAVDTYALALLPFQSTYRGINAYDPFPYLNKYTNNYDGILMSIVDINNGYRGTIPNLILFPSGITAALNNHDTFTFNGSTYKFYKVTNYGDFSGDVTSSLETIYYPAFKVS